MTHKELKQLADACRKAGIVSFKNEEVEFTLAPAPPSPKRTRNRKTLNSQPLVVDEEEIRAEGDLSEEDALYWSTDLTQENQ